MSKLWKCMVLVLNSCQCQYTFLCQVLLNICYQPVVVVIALRVVQINSVLHIQSAITHHVAQLNICIIGVGVLQIVAIVNLLVVFTKFPLSASRYLIGFLLTNLSGICRSLCYQYQGEIYAIKWEWAVILLPK